MITKLDGIVTIDTGEMLVLARKNECWASWVATADECQTRDVYRVKQLVEKGFHPKKIVDLGAQTGMYTAMVGKYFPESFIYAFEPVPCWFQMLALNAPENSMCVNAAVCGYLDAKTSKAIDHTNGDEIHWRNQNRGYANRAISVRAMMALVGSIDLLKIDVEGSEGIVVRDMDEQDVIKDIQWIVGEYHYANCKSDLSGILSKTHKVEMCEDNAIDVFWAERLPT